ncbi:hypothetical protein GGR00_001078 [Aminobacter aganoensis]|uniref:Uncharacterized protein n=1 Tax=Aminobacter aganoensis TaxID=83264 RepID=A0A7X0KJQ0_9HYPH|nr:hypothetical protein [Aminobacter aganoensis]
MLTQSAEVRFPSHPNKMVHGTWLGGFLPRYRRASVPPTAAELMLRSPSH